MGFVHIAVGEKHTCALRGDRQLDCWEKANDEGQLDVTEDLGFQQVTSSWRSFCGI